MVTDTTNPATTPENNDQKKIEYTPEQQSHIEQLIKQKQGEAAKQLRTELETTKSTMEQFKAELDAVRKEQKKAPTAEGKSEIEILKGQMEDVKSAYASLQREAENYKNSLKVKDDEVSKARSEAVSIRKSAEMSAAAGNQHFVDIGVVTKLTADSIVFDSDKGRFVVVNDDGNPRVNASFEPMTLPEFFAEFAAKNPYLVRSEARGGAGATESSRSILSSNGKISVEQVFGSGSNPKLANDLARTNKPEYMRLRRHAQDIGLIN